MLLAWCILGWCFFCLFLARALGLVCVCVRAATCMVRAYKVQQGFVFESCQIIRVK